MFVDFDGTLAPIIARPQDAAMPPGSLAALAALARLSIVSVISGRQLSDVRAKVGLDGIWYAGSHGFEIEGPAGEQFVVDGALDQREVVERSQPALEAAVSDIPGCTIEAKRFSVAVHYRGAAAGLDDEIVARVASVADRLCLRVKSGRRVLEVEPDIAWDKGRALELLKELLGISDDPDLVTVYIGDDVTDEDAFAALAEDDLGVIVRHDEHGDRPTAASFAVDSTDQTAELLRRLYHRGGRPTEPR